MLWDNLNKALCNIIASRGVTKGALKLGNLMTEGWWSLWCEGDLSWKSVAVVLAKRLTGAPEQGTRIIVWKSISLASIPGKELSCPAHSCLSTALMVSREEQTGWRNSSPKREEVSENSLEPGYSRVRVGRGVVEEAVRIVQRWKQAGVCSHSHCQVSRAVGFSTTVVLLLLLLLLLSLLIALSSAVQYRAVLCSGQEGTARLWGIWPMSSPMLALCVT